ncbi:MAG: hypothetical protein ACHQ50_01470 [Fimbriimonadales bacterium]
MPEQFAAHSDPVSVEPAQDSPAEEPEAGGKYTLASREEADAVLAKCTDALAMIPYVEVDSGEVQESNRSLIVVKCHARAARFTPEMVRLDVTTVWKSVVVGDNESIHNFADTATGYDFRFAILYTNGTFLTGCFQIEPPPNEGPPSRLSRIAPK